MKKPFKSVALSLVLTQVIVFHTENIAWAAASGNGASAMASSQGLINASAVQGFQADLFTGRATTSIPIFIPPGRKEMHPAVALNYTGSTANGWLGLGWALDLGFIRRSTREGVPKYDTTDRYEISFQGVGSRLVEVSPGIFRTEQEAQFLRIEKTGSGWVLRDKNGTRSHFGQTASSRVDTAQGTFEWRLDYVEDTNGNYMEITYQQDGGFLYLDEIHYVGHTSGLTPQQSVKFFLENTDRPDLVPTLISGEEKILRKRLKAIEVRVNGEIVRRYELNYHQSAVSGRSLLDRIRELGSDGVSTLPPTTFTYIEDPEVTYDVRTNVSASGDNRWNVRAGSQDLFSSNESILLPNGEFVGVSNIGTGHGTRTWFAEASNDPSGSLAGVNWTQDETTGAINLNGSRDSHVHFYTYFFLDHDADISFPTVQGSNTMMATFLNGNQQYFIGPPSSPLHLKKGYNLLEFTNYNQNNNWSLPIEFDVNNYPDILFMTSTQFIKPQLVGDFNGDGISDLANYLPQDTGGPKINVSVSRSFAFIPTKTWLSWPPTSTDSELTPLLGDFNKDGATDFAFFRNGTWQVARSNGVDGFFARQTWATGFGTGAEDKPLVGDFNADSFLDVGIFNKTTGSWKIAVSSGTQFGSPVEWLTNFGRQSGASGEKISPFVGDFNGDGLSDILVIVTQNTGTPQETNQWRVALSNGHAFIASTSPWLTNFALGENKEAVIFDCNGDGLTDVSYYDSAIGTVVTRLSNGHSAFETICTYPFTFSLRGSQYSFRPADFSGDGLLDPAIFNDFTTQGEVALSHGKMTELLKGVDNGRGGMTSISYRPSTEDSLQDGSDYNALPFILPLIAESTVSDGLSHSYTTLYAFSGGKYDHPTNEFRGFRHAETLDGARGKTRLTFKQDSVFKGRLEKKTILDETGHRWFEEETTWEARPLGEGAQFVYVSAVNERVFSGDTTFREKRTEYEYDDYGNLTVTRELGDIAETGDERTRIHTYEYDASSWIMNKLVRTELKDAGGIKIAEEFFAYDAKGNLAQEKNWLAKREGGNWVSEPETEWPKTSFTYDAYGNVLTVTDGLGRVTTNTYDETFHQFLKSIQNSLGHIQQFNYDPLYGELISSIDPNGNEKRTVLDVFGRPVKIIEPGDSEALPTVAMEYDFSTVPNRIITRNLETSGENGVIESVAFVDGLGRKVQIRTESDTADKQIVTGDVEYDPRGLPIKQYVSYFGDTSLSYSPPDETIRFITFEYDPLARRVKSTYPDNSESQTIYDDWHETLIDRRGNKTERWLDAYGRTITVAEHNGIDIYHTSYAYDAADDLVTTVDTSGNVTSVNYDSTGRKISLIDPDTGVTAYEYDPNGNIIIQTDNMGREISFAYDQLNRIQHKYVEGLIKASYFYDDPSIPNSIGRLTQVTEPNLITAFNYDERGREIRVRRSFTSLGQVLTMARSYDTLGRLRGVVYPDGDGVFYVHGSGGDVDQVFLAEGLIAENPVPLDPPAGSTALVNEVSYNAAGQILRMDLANGNSTGYAYDPETLRLKRLVTAPSSSLPETLPLAGGTPTGAIQDFTYAFDDNGNVTTITDSIHTATQNFTYDDLNRLTRAVNTEYRIIDYAYDPIGNMLKKGDIQMIYGEGSAGPHAVSSVKLPDGNSFDITYDGVGNMTQRGTAELAFDAESRLLSTTQPAREDESVSITLEPGWNLIAFPRLPAETPGEPSGDPTDLPLQTNLYSILTLAGLTIGKGEDTEQISRREQNDHDQDGDPWDHFVGDSDFDEYTSVSFGELYQIYCPAGTTITYGGLLPQTGVTKTLAVGKNYVGVPVPEAVDIASFLSAQNLTAAIDDIKRFDAASQTWQSFAAGDFNTLEPSRGYVFVANQPASFYIGPANLEAEFSYDSDGSRIFKSTSSISSTESVLYLGESFEVRSGKTSKSIFLGNLRISTVTVDTATQNRSAFFHHSDHIGSLNVVTGDTGEVVYLSEYTPYGLTVKEEGIRPTSFRFTDQESDETGLIYMNARYYDPLLGRFISPDDYVQNPYDPQSLNRYSYARNNPIRFVDPTGNFAFLFAIFAIVKAVVAIATIGAILTSIVSHITGGPGFKSFGKFFLTNLAAASVLVPGGQAIAAIGLTGAALATAELALAATAGSLSGGVASSLEGGRFSQGMAAGALIGVATAGGAMALRPIIKPVVRAAGEALNKLGQGAGNALRKIGANFIRSTDDLADVNISRATALSDNVEVVSQKVSSGARIYRRGNFPSGSWIGNKIKGPNWAPENPLTTKNFVKVYGLSSGNSNDTPNWVVGGHVRNLNRFTVEPAPGIRSNTGGKLQVSFEDPEKEIILDFFHMVDER